jgi:hypothetical protein
MFEEGTARRLGALGLGDVDVAMLHDRIPYVSSSGDAPRRKLNVENA